MQILDTPESWGHASRGYAEKVAPFLMRSYADAFADRLDLCPEAELIEVGAGSGALTEALFPQVKSILATDYAPQMIDILRERMSELGAVNVRCEVMDGQAIEREDASFDRAASSFALMLFSDRAKGFSELGRVVRSGGRVVVSGWAGPDQFEVFALLLAAIREAFPNRPAPTSPPPIFSLANPDSFRREMESGGFQNVEVEFVTRELEVASFEQMWEMLTTGAPPVQALLQLVGNSGQARLHDQLRTMVAKRYGEGPIVTTNVATFATGTAP